MKKLLFAMLCIVSALGMRAQLTDGTVYWIQDAVTGQFISQGADWGTQATVKNVSGLGFEVAYVSDGVYKLKNVMWNNMNNAERGLGSGRYVDSGAGNGSSTIAEVKLTESGDGYKLSIDGNYLTNNGSAKDYSGTKVLGSTTDASSATVWKFLTKAEYDAALSTIKDNRAAELATIVGIDGITSFSALETELAKNDYVSVDQTSKITNAALDAGNINGWTGTAPNQRKLAFGSENGTCAESWNGVAWARQTISNLPNGLYKVTFVGTFRPGSKGNAESLTPEQTSSPAYVYANNDCEEFIHWIDVSAKANKRSEVVNNVSNYTSTFYTYVSNGTIELGVVQDAYYNTQTWCPFGKFTLTQIYSIAMYKKAYDDAMTAATNAQTSLTGFSVFASQKSTLDAAITENTLSGDDLSDVDKLTEAANKLNAAAEAVVKEKVACDQYASIVSTIGENTNVVLTSFVSNAGFEQGNLNGWTSTNAGGIADNNNFSQKVGTYFVERWQPSGNSQVKLSDGTLTHDAIVLPAGIYQISATGQVQEQKNGVTGGGYFLYANSDKVEIGAPARYNTYVKLNDDKSKLVIKFALESCTGNWISCDDVQLTYVGSDFPAVTLVEGKMSTAAATAQTIAKEAFDADKTGTNYKTLVAAIAAAQTSKDAYAKTATAIADAKTLGANFNFATAAATTTFNEAVTAVETAYNDGTLEDASAKNCANLGTVLVGWHPARSSENYTIAEAYMKSAWTGGELNDWSTEGDTDGSNFHVPFFQNWIDDAYSLTEGTTFGQLTGLDNGLYRVSAQVRVRIKNGQEAGTAPSGITLKVNNGSEVNVCAGGQIGESQFYLGTFEAEGLVKDGTLNAIFTRADGNNVSWLSFKNVQYTKVRDLIPAEEAPATVEDYDALNTAIANAEAKTLGFDEGDYAPYNNITVLAALAAAKAINQEGDNAHDDVVAATNAIADSEWNANAEEVNAVYDGTFAAATNNGAPKGWRMTNNTLGGDYHSRAFVGDDRMSEFNGTNSGFFLRFDGTNSSRGSMYYYGDTKNYTMPLKEGVKYFVKVDVAGWGSTGKPIRMNVNGPTGFSSVNQQLTTSVRADNADNTPQQFFIVFTANVAGNYVINFQTPGADTNTHNVVISNVELFRASEATMKTFKAGTYGTFIAPFDVTIPSGVTASKVTGHTGNTLELTDLPGTIPANTPVVVYSDAVINETFYGKDNSAGETSKEVGLLVGVYTASPVAEGNYVLQTQGGVQGFYKVGAGGLTAVPNRAYLKAGALDDAVKAYFFDQTDAVRGLQAEEAAEGTIYNLSGQRVQKAQKGIYIVNGKKTVIK